MTRNMQKRDSTGDAIREAIRGSGLTRYRIAKDSGVSESTLCRFMVGEQDLTTATMDKVADALGVEVVVRRKKRS